jgi:hypothetical protein
MADVLMVSHRIRCPEAALLTSYKDGSSRDWDVSLGLKDERWIKIHLIIINIMELHEQDFTISPLQADVRA